MEKEGRGRESSPFLPHPVSTEVSCAWTEAHLEGAMRPISSCRSSCQHNIDHLHPTPPLFFSKAMGYGQSEARRGCLVPVLSTGPQVQSHIKSKKKKGKKKMLGMEMYVKLLLCKPGAGIFGS